MSEEVSKFCAYTKYRPCCRKETARYRNPFNDLSGVSIQSNEYNVRNATYDVRRQYVTQ